MLHLAEGRRSLTLVLFAVCGAIAVLAPSAAVGQPAQPVTAEPNHKIRLDNGTVRMYEVVLPVGASTLMHEHRADSFSIIFRNAEITNEPLAGAGVKFPVPAGAVGFASTASGPYSHRILASGNEPFHVIALELLSPKPGTPPAADRRPSAPFTVVADNVRGRAYRYSLAPGESTGVFTRHAGTAVFAISAGRIAETAEGKAPRLWDFEPGHFRWVDAAENLSVRNEGAAPLQLVEIEVF